MAAEAAPLPLWEAMITPATFTDHPPPGQATTPVPRVRRRLATSAWLLVLSLAVVTFGFVASRPASPPDAGPPTGGALAAQQAIEALVHPGQQATALALLPADFTQVTGVVPGQMQARDGTVRAVHVDGGCSTPWGDDNTKWDYAVPCKAHDLGYDLLRYAAAVGHPLGQDVREALDQRLSDDMHAACVINPMDSPRTCRVVASLYSAGLVVNSWHQRWGPPVGDPIGPLLAGVAVIGCLLIFRLRGWLQHRHARVATPPPPAATRPPAPLSPWVTLGVGSLVLLILGESAIALARWAGVGADWLWPLTWVAQLAPVFFFAGGRANAAGWRATRDSGGGYRQYLAHRASWLLRPALIFVVVALLVPLALELLGIPEGTNAAIMRIALHPLWLLGIYLLTVVATPLMLALHRCAAAASVAGLLAFVVLAEMAARAIGSPIPRYLAAFGLALLAQQVAFGRIRTSNRLLLVGVTAAGVTGLALLTTVGGLSRDLLGAPGAPPALSGPTLPVLLLGAAQIGLLGLAAKPLARLTTRCAGLARLAMRAPMSLYLGFLAAMLLVVALVYLPDHPAAIFGWVRDPRTWFALALLAVPALMVFWWFERHPRETAVPVADHPASDGWLAHAATMLGIGFAVVGLFGFALTRFGGDDGSIMGLPVDPIQNLIQLLIGVFLLHTVRTGLSGARSTWVVTGVACVPALLSAADPVTMAVHGVTALIALAAVASTLVSTKAVAQNT
ncbi:phospholipase A2 [Amycolatopsis tucumanensis]|uniref:Phospholipase A2 n=2 Tax=Pseudonocardiaceae TaxID=2070 RepID=A0ABP7IEI6_9PSEU